jgi:DNA helicase IV
MPSSTKTELSREQSYVTMLYARLDVLRAQTAERLSAVRLDTTAEHDQAWAERESFAQLYQDRGAELAAAERSLCFGRLDLDDGDRFYVGRLGLRSEERLQLLVDWRAPAAQAFYRATAVERYGITRRRHLQTLGRRVVRLDDDVLDLDAVDPSQLTGEAALLASLGRHRTGRMGDIVSTIQGDQDRIIRDDLRGILVVEGGPGTGKTVVALHRAAYLLYTYREQLSRRGILVVGPNGTFMQYIDQVLPSLGENDVVLATIGSLFPGVDAHASEPERAAEIKGRAGMVDALAGAVADLPHVPEAAIELRVGGAAQQLTPAAIRRAQGRARSRHDPDTGEPLPHNIARPSFARALLGELADEPAAEGALQLLWPEFTPQELLALLYAEPERLDLTPDERDVIRRVEPGPWTPADVPLLDELAELLGEPSSAALAARRRRAAAAAEQAEIAEYAAQVVDNLAETEAIFLPKLEEDTFKQWIAGRNAQDEAIGSLAERALANRSWGYGHVVVDEAQELSPMAWRMLLRRCPSRSMTIVGDLAQTGAAGGADSWAQMLDPLVPGRWRTARLSVNYRTPRAAMALAARLLPAGVESSLSVREGAEQPWTERGGDLVALVSRESGLVGAGRVAVIAPSPRVDQVAATLGVEPGPDLEAPVAVLTAGQAKGLEFDSVIVVDAAAIEQASPRGRADLYVALTRTTRRLGLVSDGPLPAELTAAFN